MRDDCMPTRESSGDSLDTGDFWMVWNVHGRAPTVAHSSLEIAEQEAKRLARVAPGETFVVLQALYAFKVATPAPPPVERLALNLIDHIPF